MHGFNTPAVFPVPTLNGNQLAIQQQPVLTSNNNKMPSLQSDETNNIKDENGSDSDSGYDSDDNGNSNSKENKAMIKRQKDSFIKSLDEDF